MAYQSEIEKLTRRWNENPEQYFAPLADAYRKAGEVDLALDVVRAGLAKRPNYVSAHIVLGRCLLDQKKDAEAAKVFEQVLQLDAENIIALRILGEIGERTHDVAGALGWLKRLLEVDPMNDDAQEAIKRLEAAGPAVPLPTPVAAAPVAESAAQAAGTVAGFEATTLEESPATAGGGAFTIERAESAMESGEPAPAPTLEMESMQLESPAGTVESEPGLVDLEPAASAIEPTPAAEESVLQLERAGEPEQPASGLEMLALDEPAAEPPPSAPVRASASWSKQALPQDLPLILPEEETLPGSAPRLEPAVPAAGPVPAGAPGAPAETVEPEPVITETMAEVYLRQGLVREAREVYQKLVQQRPGDSLLRRRLEDLKQRVSPARGGVPPARSRFAAAETGGVPARSFLSQVLSARPGSGEAAGGADGADAGTGASEAPAGRVSSMEAAFAEEPVQTAGAPTSPASDELSLASVFGEEAAPVPKPGPAAPTPPPGGFSFDEFFGGKPGAGPSPAQGSDSAAPAADPDAGGSDDFMSWLKGLKS